MKTHPPTAGSCFCYVVILTWSKKKQKNKVKLFFTATSKARGGENACWFLITTVSVCVLSVCSASQLLKFWTPPEQLTSLTCFLTLSVYENNLFKTEIHALSVLSSLCNCIQKYWLDSDSLQCSNFFMHIHCNQIISMSSISGALSFI